MARWGHAIAAERRPSHCICQYGAWTFARDCLYDDVRQAKPRAFLWQGDDRHERKQRSVTTCAADGIRRRRTSLGLGGNEGSATVADENQHGPIRLPIGLYGPLRIDPARRQAGARVLAEERGESFADLPKCGQRDERGRGASSDERAGARPARRDDARRSHAPRGDPASGRGSARASASHSRGPGPGAICPCRGGASLSSDEPAAGDGGAAVVVRPRFPRPMRRRAPWRRPRYRLFARQRTPPLAAMPSGPDDGAAPMKAAPSGSASPMPWRSH